MPFQLYFFTKPHSNPCTREMRLFSRTRLVLTQTRPDFCVREVHIHLYVYWDVSVYTPDHDIKMILARCVYNNSAARCTAHRRTQTKNSPTQTKRHTQQVECVSFCVKGQRKYWNLKRTIIYKHQTQWARDGRPTEKLFSDSICVRCAKRCVEIREGWRLCSYIYIVMRFCYFGCNHYIYTIHCWCFSLMVCDLWVRNILFGIYSFLRVVQSEHSMCGKCAARSRFNGKTGIHTLPNDPIAKLICLALLLVIYLKFKIWFYRNVTKCYNL